MKIYLVWIVCIYFVCSQLPLQLNWSNRDGVNYMGVNINQNFPAKCDSGWAFATLNAFTPRIKFRMNQTGFMSTPDISLSAQVLL